MPCSTPRTNSTSRIARWPSSSGAVRIDRRRHPEIDQAVRSIRVGTGFFRDLIAFGVETGEIAEDRKGMVSVYLDTVLTGLTDAVSTDDKRHSRRSRGVETRHRRPAADAVAHASTLTPEDQVRPAVQTIALRSSVR